MHGPALVHQSIIRIVHWQSGCVYINICRNIVHLEMKLAGAWWKEAFPKCVSASPSDL